MQWIARSGFIRNAGIAHPAASDPRPPRSRSRVPAPARIAPRRPPVALDLGRGPRPGTCQQPGRQDRTIRVPHMSGRYRSPADNHGQSRTVRSLGGGRRASRARRMLCLPGRRTPPRRPRSDRCRQVGRRAEQPLHLRLRGAVHWPQVKVQAVLDRRGFGTEHEHRRGIPGAWQLLSQVLELTAAVHTLDGTLLVRLSPSSQPCRRTSLLARVRVGWDRCSRREARRCGRSTRRGSGPLR